MKKNIAIAVVALLLGVLLFTFIDCSTGGAPGSVPTVEDTRKTIEGATVGYPPTATDAYTTFFTISFIDIFVMIADLYLDTDIFPYQGSNGTYTYSYSGDGDSFTLTLKIVWDAGKGMWHYTLTISGTIDTVIYNNFIVFDMYAKPDGSSGEISFYDPDNQEDFLTVTWNKGEPYITFTLTAQHGEDSFTITLKETIPVFDPVQDQWVSESGIVRIEESGSEPVEASWGPSPPSL